MFYNIPGNKGYYRYPPFKNIRNEKKNNKMEVEGNGKVKAIPDIAVITLGVITENKDLKTAQQQNKIKTNKVFNALNEIGVDDKDIQTIAYNINQYYDYIDGKQVFRGYKVTNKFTITTDEIDKIGLIIDTAVENGANYANEIQFKVSNPSYYYNKALTLAVEDAVKKAEDIGNTLGVYVKEVPIKIVEQNFKSNYLPRQPYYRAPEAITPIEAGEIEFKAKVTAIFSY